ncbi:unnamed protein product, partial [Candidula unifasciata]
LSSILGKLPGMSSEQISPEAAGKQFENDFQELKERCQPIFAADPSQRFLRGYVTADAAFTAIIKYNKWRKDYNVDNLSTDDPDIMSELAKGTVHILRNRDKKNRPILYVAVRKHLASDRDLDKLTKFTVYMLEQTFKKLNEEIVDTICIVFDLRKFTLANMDYQFVKRLVWLLGKYYPERLGICLIYGAPMVFQGCWAVIRPWLNEVTASKVTFVGTEEQLCQYLNPDCLPPCED